MVAFIGSWVIAWLLGGGLILAVILYFLFFKKNALATLAMRAVVKAFTAQPTFKPVRKPRAALV
jgi:hypothetical protein